MFCSVVKLCLQGLYENKLKQNTNFIVCKQWYRTMFIWKNEQNHNTLPANAARSHKCWSEERPAASDDSCNHICKAWYDMPQVNAHILLTKIVRSNLFISQPACCLNIFVNSCSFHGPVFRDWMNAINACPVEDYLVSILCHISSKPFYYVDGFVFCLCHTETKRGLLYHHHSWFQSGKSLQHPGQSVEGTTFHSSLFQISPYCC